MMAACATGSRWWETMVGYLAVSQQIRKHT